MAKPEVIKARSHSRRLEEAINLHRLERIAFTDDLTQAVGNTSGYTAAATAGAAGFADWVSTADTLHSCSRRRSCCMPCRCLAATDRDW